MATYLIGGLLLWLGYGAVSGVWVMRAKPPHRVIFQYPWSIIWRCFWPFGDAWLTKLVPEDIARFREYTRRRRIWYLSFILPVGIGCAFWFASVCVRH